ncbi:MAG TPA: hypothetical protein VFK16_09170 [Gemmatimonadaceae bacterium]|jgi:hypothetical protein|nr:hypothetical protein [Gemmatimonadaceae bacterium]
MRTPAELTGFLRELGATKVLTVYYPARVTDPAQRHAWRAALGTALRSARQGIADSAEQAEFDRAVAYLDDPWPPIDGVWGTRGWVAFLTADGARYASSLPVAPPTLVVWRLGPVITPYLRALKQHRPVFVALVDSRSAQFYRYADDALTPLPDLALAVPDDEPGSPERPAARGASHATPRGKIDTEGRTRRKRAAFDRMAGAMTARLTDLAGDDGWILIGGTPEWARRAGEAMPAPYAGRVMVSTTLDHGTDEAGIAEAAKHAASQLRAAQGLILVQDVFERSGAGGHGAYGVPAVQRAVHAGAVNLLFASPRFLNEPSFDVEALVRSAMARGAEVEVMSGDAAAELDRRADGVAARLRYPIERAATSGGAAGDSASGGSPAAPVAAARPA